MLLVIKLVSNLIKGKGVYTDSLMITSSRLFTSKSGKATGPKYSTKNGGLNAVGKCELFAALICESYEILHFCSKGERIIKIEEKIKLIEQLILVAEKNVSVPPEHTDSGYWKLKEQSLTTEKQSLTTEKQSLLDLLILEKKQTIVVATPKSLYYYF